MMRFMACVLGMAMLAGCGEAYEVNPAFVNNAVNENSQILYSPGGVYWSDGGMVEDRIVFTRHVSSGSGGYSEYTAEKEAPLYLPSNYEFLYEGRLIGYNTANLKFFEARYEDGTFNAVELSAAQIGDLFPGLELLKISEAKDGVLTVKRRPGQVKSFLLVNDTDRDFHRYSFENRKAAEPFKSLLTVDSFDEIVFSHFGSRDELFPILRIKVAM